MFIAAGFLPGFFIVLRRWAIGPGVVAFVPSLSWLALRPGILRLTGFALRTGRAWRPGLLFIAGLLGTGLIIAGGGGVRLIRSRL